MDFTAIENLSKQANQFIMSLPCRNQSPYPSSKISEKNSYIADLLLNAYANGGNSELTAITQYIFHKFTIKENDVSNLEFCIALVEMHHLELLGNVIESLGGNPRYERTNKAFWTGGNVSYGNNLCEKLSLDIHSEQDAITGYNSILRILQKEGGPGSDQVSQVLKRIIDDEQVHLELFKQAYMKYC